MRVTEIGVGQRYREVGTNYLGLRKAVWAVDAVFTSTDSLRYARLVNVADATLRKTLALDALTDRHRFMLVAESGAK